MRGGFAGQCYDVEIRERGRRCLRGQVQEDVEGRCRVRDDIHGEWLYPDRSLDHFYA